MRKETNNSFYFSVNRRPTIFDKKMKEKKKLKRDVMRLSLNFSFSNDRRQYCAEKVVRKS